MYTEEMKAVEVLLNYALLHGGLKETIEEEFGDVSEFTKAKMNIFNLISIHIIASSPGIPDIDYDVFLSDGRCDLYNKSIKSVYYELNRILNSREIVEEIIEGLRFNKYSFDNQNNIVVKTDSLTATITKEWLCRLSELCRQTSFKRIFLYNKKHENDITDEKSLLNYLYHTKTYHVSLTSDTDINLKGIYNEATPQTKSILSSKKKVQIEDIREAFKSSVGNTVKSHVEKYTIPSYTYILKRASQVGDAFYNKPLNVQKEFISKWLLEMEVSNNKAIEELRKLILYTKTNTTWEDISSRVDINNAILGLFNTYIRLLKDSDLDLFDISISKIKLKKYINDKTVEYYDELRNIIKQINSIEDEDKEEDSITNSISRRLHRINDTATDEGSIDDELTVLTQEFEIFKRRQKNKDELANRRNTIQNIIHYNHEHSLEEIAFDNEKIVGLILNAISNGRVYFDDNHRDRIVIECFDKELGLVTFKSEIKLSDFLTMVEDVNFSIANKEEDYTLAA